MNILFVCTHNRCRSILCEAIANHLNSPHLQGHSAGSQPVGEVHPLSLKFLAEKGIHTDGLHSKSWEQFSDQQPDLVITVCDSAAGESCPLWMGKSLTFHWGLADPSKLEGSEDQLRSAFFAVMDCIQNRLKALIKASLQADDPTTLKQALTRIAQQFPAPDFEQETR